MDVQVADENGAPGAVMQHFELLSVLQYAENWADISNDAKQNKEVRERIVDIRSVICKWVSK